MTPTNTYPVPETLTDPLSAIPSNPPAAMPVDAPALWQRFPQAALAGVTGSALGITLHNDTCLPYFLSFCNEEQKKRWLPGIASGELITAVGMTEPGAGSDLSGIRTSASGVSTRILAEAVAALVEMDQFLPPRGRRSAH